MALAAVLVGLQLESIYRCAEEITLGKVECFARSLIVPF